MSGSKKTTTLGKKASREPERVIIDPDEPIKPDDQLELSAAVSRLKTKFCDNRVIP